MVVELKPHVTKIQDWPRPGIVTYDIGAALAKPPLFQEIVSELSVPYHDQAIDLVVGLEARGFVLAGAVARVLDTGVVLMRKKGKLAPPTIVQEYSYEYAAQVIELQAGAIVPGQRVAVIDDTLATGGTMAAAIKLIKQLGGVIVGLSFVVEMRFMAGADRLKEFPVHSLVTFD